MSAWKWVGLAGVLGAAAAGAAVVHHQRNREVVDYEPDELRARLHARLNGDGAPADQDSAASAS